jgi:serine/threonine protein phosphatase PrpC
VLTIRDENLLWSESEENPVKRVVSPCVNVAEENGSITRKCPSPPVKRKRPQRLDIPPQSLGVDALCAVKQQPMEVNVEGFHYAVACKKGRREFMEDTHKAIENVLGDPKQAFFGVFDGHSGRKAAAFAAENIGQNIADAMLGMRDETEDILEQAVRAGYLATDAEFLKQEVGSGTACVTALIIDGNLVVSNAGDCRAVICRDGASEALTCDHRAGREDERQRIENLGGIVDIRHGVWRVQGSLAVSRAIGDSHMKEWISAEPDTRKIEITSDCEFLILASDGLWDKVSNQEAVDIARPFCVEKQPDLAPLGGGLTAACKKLVALAVTRKSHDDVSVMIVQLGHFCKKEN